MITITIEPTQQESARLDTLLWEVLWKPLNLPPSFRESVAVKGKQYEHIALQDKEVVGGFGAIHTPGTGCEIRHIAVVPRFRNLGCGTMLLRSILESAEDGGVYRIHTIARMASYV